MDVVGVVVRSDGRGGEEVGKETPRTIECKLSKGEPATTPLKEAEARETKLSRQDWDGNRLRCFGGHPGPCEFPGGVRYLPDWKPSRVSVGADYYLRINHGVSNDATLRAGVAKQGVTEQAWGRWYRFIESLNEIQQEKDEPTFLLGGDIPHEPEIRMSNEK